MTVADPSGVGIEIRAPLPCCAEKPASAEAQRVDVGAELMRGEQGAKRIFRHVRSRRADVETQAAAEDSRFDT